MSLIKSGRGGTRQGAGRPKKQGELQKTHSIRATDEEWKYIQMAARTIKASDISTRQPKVLMLNDDEFGEVKHLLLNNVIKKRHNEALEEIPKIELSVPAEQAVQLEAPSTPTEEEAVSVFLEYYRLNPIEALSIVRARRDRERRIIEMRERRISRKRELIELQERAEDALAAADNINEQVAKMLQFPG